MSSQAPIQSTQWPIVRLSDVTTKIGSGATPRGGSETYLSTRETFAFVRSQNVFDRRFDSSSVVFIGDEQAAHLRNAHLRTGDVLLNITGDGITFGRAALVDDAVLPACVNQHVAIIRADRTKAVPGYLLSFLTHPAVKPYVGSFSSGGSRRAVTKGHIGSFLLPLPPLETQRAIAATLGALDDKIESNRRAIQLLRQLAITTLIRAGDTRRVVRQVADVRKGISYKGAGLADATSGMPMVNMGNAANHGWLKREGFKFYRGDHKSHHIAPAGSLIVTGVEQTWRNDIIGWPLLVPSDVGDVLFTHHMFFVDFLPGNEWMRLPLWAHLYTPTARARLESMVHGTTVATLPPSALSELSFLSPPQGSPSVTAADAMIRCAWNLELESKQLAALRDALLPELLSGRVRVDDPRRTNG